MEEWRGDLWWEGYRLTADVLSCSELQIKRIQLWEGLLVFSEAIFDEIDMKLKNKDFFQKKEKKSPSIFDDQGMLFTS